MILGGIERETAGNRTTLDELFSRAGVRHADAIALIDPPNRESFTDGAPRRLTFAQADRAISAFAARLRGLGLQTDTVIGLQLPNTVESIIALLGTLRAGMIAAPLPLLWRKQQIVDALSRVGAKAIVTASRIGPATHAEHAVLAAVDLFSIRHVCAFGRDLPDGVVPLDDVFDAAPEFTQSPPRPGNAAAHVAVVTFDIGAGGLMPVARNHVELIAGGLAAYLETGAVLDGHTLSAIPLGSFAGLALGLVPWLLGGGTLELHHGFDPDVLNGQCQAADGCVVLPGPALMPLAEAGLIGAKIIVALWRSPEKLGLSARWHGDAALVDIASFGEFGLLAGMRGPEGHPIAIPYGGVGAPRSSKAAITVIEVLRSGAGKLQLRGPMVPAYAFPSAEAQPTPDAMGVVDTGYACRLEGDSQTLVITAPPAGITCVGGYRFRQNDIDWQVADADIDAVIVALPDALLGQRLAGTAPNRAATAAELAVRGVNPLISGAFRARNASEAA
ncbi:MAG: class I adenylate-forming enzyme family protein [Pseudolabrys sp.]